MTEGIQLDGTDSSIQISERDYHEVYLPLAEFIAERLKTHSKRRYIIGIAGHPGAGKTTLSLILARILKQVINAGLDDHESVVAVPLDGFHYSNEYLSLHEGVGLDGVRRCLAQMKGQCITFDCRRALRSFLRIRKGENLALPVYDRLLHDPVEDAVAVTSQTRLVIIEGNYLFLDTPCWSDMRDVFDLKIFVTAPREVLEQRILARHIRGGSTKAEGLQKIKQTDRPNIAAVDGGVRIADIVVEWCRGVLKLDMY